jgi:hypothetical protein
MATEVETEARILGGLPVIVVGRVYPAEPDVGCGESAEVDDICWPSGKSIPTRMWERISQKDLDACHDALLDEGSNAAVAMFWAKVDYLHQQARDRKLDEQIDREMGL